MGFMDYKLFINIYKYTYNLYNYELQQNFIQERLEINKFEYFFYKQSGDANYFWKQNIVDIMITERVSTVFILFSITLKQSKGNQQLIQRNKDYIICRNSVSVLKKLPPKQLFCKVQKGLCNYKVVVQSIKELFYTFGFVMRAQSMKITENNII